MTGSTHPLGLPSRLCRCGRGISALEFALVAPLFFLLIFGMVEIALVMFTRAAAEGGLREASRFGITGRQAEDAAAREQEILQILADHTLGMIDLSEARITMKTYDSFNDVGQPEPFTDADPLNGIYDPGEVYIDLNGNGQWDEDRGVDGVGNAGDIVQYRIEYDWKLMMPIVGQILGDDGHMEMSASVVVRNEPWDFAQSGD